MNGLPIKPINFQYSIILLDKTAQKANLKLDGKTEVAQGIVPNPDIVSNKNIEELDENKVKNNNIQFGDGVFVIEK